LSAKVFCIQQNSAKDKMVSANRQQMAAKISPKKIVQRIVSKSIAKKWIMPTARAQSQVKILLGQKSETTTEKIADENNSD
jgi:hypothetical protein